MMRFDRPARLLFATLFVAMASTACGASDKGIKKAAEAITESAFRGLVEGISADEMEGRAPGTPGEQRTVEYLEREFLELGLQPVSGGSFRQEVALVEITATDAKLSFARGASGMTLAFGDDMVIGTRRVRPESSIEDSAVVFVGYGIVAPEYGWNDYAGINMRGKTALILVNDPGFATGDPTLFRGQAMTYHGRWTYKFEEAARQGATAAIIIHDTAPAAYDWEVVRNGWSGPQFHADRADGNAGRTALEGWITLDRARQLMELAGLDLDAMMALAAQRGFRPVPLGVTASGGVQNVIRRASSPNLAAVMPGKDRPDEYVIYVAHWDHLGRSPALDGDNIFNGAVDNGSGIAGILTIARGFREMIPGPARSVMFLAVTAEESGLIGSEHYAEQPLAPLAKTAAVINLDALVPLGRARDVEVVGFGASQLEDLLAAAAKSQGRTLMPDRRPEAGYFYRSDHFNFAKAGVPALYIKSGTTLRDGSPGAGLARYDEYYASRYHKPGDEYQASWDVGGTIEDLRLLFEVGAKVANQKSWPEWYEGNEFRAARDATAASRGRRD
ncbi:MAG: M28 family metallopeptidase [Steroidobacteraceae bacterium]